MTIAMYNNVYSCANMRLTRREIALCLVFDGFGFVAWEQGWSGPVMSHKLALLGDVEARLSDTDCQRFVRGLASTASDGEQCMRHVKDFTHNLMQRWGVLQ